MKKNALLIGASRGLGLGLAAELASRGWQVVGTARRPAEAKGLQGLAAKGGVTVEAIDIARAEDVDALARRLDARTFDLLFVNAGIAGAQGATVETARREDLAEILWVNALSPVRLAQRLLPRVATGGTVAFMSSVLGSIAENTSGGFDLYRASKVALNMLAHGFAIGARERRIATLSLHPGWVRTDMGGPQAPLSIEESVRGLADVLERPHAAEHRFLDYTGREIPW
jgi:NAD(P)-dependent dehydrogenase (short-subunit alcohol dehydrogenase family)